jgi:hypothetical protein
MSKTLLSFFTQLQVEKTFFSGGNKRRVIKYMPYIVGIIKAVALPLAVTRLTAKG